MTLVLERGWVYLTVAYAVARLQPQPANRNVAVLTLWEATVSEGFAVSVAQWENFQFLIDFNQDGVADLLTDEAEPIGAGRGPDPSRLLAAAVGNCLSSSLLFCLRKAKIETQGFACEVKGQQQRNEAGRLRIRDLSVKLQPKLVNEADLSRINQCLGVFEDYCIVTESVRAGINVAVAVEAMTAATDLITPV
jgi:uncharacterized OsmC-like protein